MDKETPNEKDREKLMYLYLVSYQQGSRFPFEATIQHVPSIGDKNPIKDHVYLFNSKTKDVKTVIVKSQLDEEQFSKFLQNCHQGNLIHSYFYVRYKQENAQYCSGTFDRDEVNKFNLMKTMTSFHNTSSEIKGFLKERNFDDPLDMLEYEFESIVGLNNVKDHLKELYYHLEVLKERKKHDLPDDPISLHAVFKGAPGTGKTTIARIYGKLYKKLGILSKGHLVELDRSDLVGQYIGHTEDNTKKKLEESLDGILFIDEAYSLKSDDDSNDYGKIAMEVILKFMEDNRDRISVIVAGYNDKMDKFLDSNEGLRSRFTNFYDFENYTHKELAKIFDIMMKKEKYEYSSSVKNDMINFFKKLKAGSDPSYFGNAREVRNVCGDLKKIQHKRIYSNKNFKKKGKKLLVKIIKNDIENLYSKYGFKFGKSNGIWSK
ncbi:MAG: AAA family ATPase [Bacteroidota bacterium]|nr:AAA family ATPase [Bacteroidota bacterium]